jgi:hypothetical protein
VIEQTSVRGQTQELLGPRSIPRAVHSTSPNPRYPQRCSVPNTLPIAGGTNSSCSGTSNHYCMRRARLRMKTNTRVWQRVHSTGHDRTGRDRRRVARVVHASNTQSMNAFSRPRARGQRRPGGVSRGSIEIPRHLYTISAQLLLKR